MEGLEAKDYFTIIISSLALCISIISNFIQRRKDVERDTRKNLTATIENILKINLEFNRLKENSLNYNSESVLSQRRNLNSQKRILMDHGDYLAKRFKKLLTDMDCVVLAESFDSIMDFPNAEKYWQMAIFNSSGIIKHRNFRGYARFLFAQGQSEKGRSCYREALEMALPDSDQTKLTITDTYILWAAAERDHDKPIEAKNLIVLAKNSCSQINTKKMRNEMEEQIRFVSDSVANSKISPTKST